MCLLCIMWCVQILRLSLIDGERKAITSNNEMIPTMTFDPQPCWKRSILEAFKSPEPRDIPQDLFRLADRVDQMVASWSARRLNATTMTQETRLQFLEPLVVSLCHLQAMSDRWPHSRRLVVPPPYGSACTTSISPTNDKPTQLVIQTPLEYAVALLVDDASRVLQCALHELENPCGSSEGGAESLPALAGQRCKAAFKLFKEGHRGFQAACSLPCASTAFVHLASDGRDLCRFVGAAAQYMFSRTSSTTASKPAVLAKLAAGVSNTPMPSSMRNDALQRKMPELFHALAQRHRAEFAFSCSPNCPDLAVALALSNDAMAIITSIRSAAEYHKKYSSPFPMFPFFGFVADDIETFAKMVNHDNALLYHEKPKPLSQIGTLNEEPFAFAADSCEACVTVVAGGGMKAADATTNPFLPFVGAFDIPLTQSASSPPVEPIDVAPPPVVDSKDVNVVDYLDNVLPPDAPAPQVNHAAVADLGSVYMASEARELPRYLEAARKALPPNLFEAFVSEASSLINELCRVCDGQLRLPDATQYAERGGRLSSWLFVVADTLKARKDRIDAVNEKIAALKTTLKVPPPAGFNFATPHFKPRLERWLTETYDTEAAAVHSIRDSVDIIVVAILTNAHLSANLLPPYPPQERSERSSSSCTDDAWTEVMIRSFFPSEWSMMLNALSPFRGECASFGTSPTGSVTVERAIEVVMLRKRLLEDLTKCGDLSRVVQLRCDLLRGLKERLMACASLVGEMDSCLKALEAELAVLTEAEAKRQRELQPISDKLKVSGKLLGMLKRNREGEEDDTTDEPLRSKGSRK